MLSSPSSAATSPGSREHPWTIWLDLGAGKREPNRALNESSRQAEGTASGAAAVVEAPAAPEARHDAGARPWHHGLGGRMWRGLKSERSVAAALLIAACILRTLDPAPVESLRLALFDLYQTWKPRVPTQYPVLIVDVDEASLAEVGQWPWPRTVLARMVTQLTELGAVTIGFDAIFPEPDRTSPKRLAETLSGIDEATAEALRRLPGNDEVFAQALRRSRVVLGRSVRPDVVKSGDAEPPMLTPVALVGGDPRPHLGRRYPSLVRNLPELEKAAAGRGIILPGIERDAVVRRVPVAFTVGGEIHPALAIEMLRVATGKSAYAIRSNATGITGAVVAGRKIPTDRRGRFWVRFGPHDRARYVSAKDVLSGAVPKARVFNRLVLVGFSASGLFDSRATPLGVSMPGVEIHAQMLENILAQEFLVRPPQALGAELAAILFAGLLMIVLQPRLGAGWALLLLADVVATGAFASWYLFADKGMLIDLAYAALVTLAVYSYLTYANYSRSEAQRQEVRTAFSRYLSPVMVEQLANDPSRLQLGGEDRFMTLLFCDVEDFTMLSEHYDARALTRLVNRFLTPMTEAIMMWKGTVDKYMGDSVMAFWNAPLDDPDHARNACMTALEIHHRIALLNQELEREAEESGEVYRPIKVGVGVNSGHCMVGNLGSEQRFDYSVLGDTVNVASRLEGQTRSYRVGTVMGESVYALVSELAVLELDLVQVVGKTVPERIYTVLGDEEMAAGEAFQALEQAHREMLGSYRERDWEGAEKALERCRELGRDFALERLYDMFERRVATYEMRPPSADWGGVFVAKSK